MTKDLETKSFRRLLEVLKALRGGGEHRRTVFKYEKPLHDEVCRKELWRYPCVFVCVIYTSLNSPLCNWGTLICRVVVRK